MRDLSMHVLDIVMNSIKANATVIEIKIVDNDDFMSLMIKDNGIGMNKEKLETVLDPFYTTRITRSVGLGLPLLFQNVKSTNGTFNIMSSENKGTVVEAYFNKTHIDCIPLGNMDETILSLIIMEPTIDFIYSYKKNESEYILNTKTIKKILNGVPINEKSIINWLKEDLVNKFSY